MSNIFHWDCHILINFFTLINKALFYINLETSLFIIRAVSFGNIISWPSEKVQNVIIFVLNFMKLRMQQILQVIGLFCENLI